MFNIDRVLKNDSILEKFKKDDVIFQDGELTNKTMYIIVEGRVDVYKIGRAHV